MSPCSPASIPSRCDGKRSKAQFRIAKGSVLEVIAAYELAEAYDESVPVAQIRRLGRRVAAMLTRLAY